MANDTGESVVTRVIKAYTYVFIWIALSAGEQSCQWDWRYLGRSPLQHGAWVVYRLLTPQPPCSASGDAGVIMQNKYILAFAGFPYPIALTMWCATPRSSKLLRCTCLWQ